MASTKRQGDSSEELLPPPAQPGEKRKPTLAVGGVACAPDLWVIHGKYYDFEPFISRHPGGVEMISLGRGRDCTEMFESIHSLSHRAIHKMLQQYEVDEAPEGAPPPPEDAFSWNEGGFYATVKQRVQAYFDDRKLSHKATPFYWLKISTMFCLWAYFISHALLAATSANAILCAIAAGFLMNMMGFCAMHDGSHYGISKAPWVNKVLHAVWSDWNLWSHFIWLRHHVYGHHSYTAIYRKDPDMVNIMPLVRKSTITRFKSFHKFQQVSAWILLTVLPNQHLGQALMYVKAWVDKKLFSTVPIEKCPDDTFAYTAVIYVFSLFFHFFLPFWLLDGWTAYFLILAYWSAQGVGYFVNIAPNHDTLDTHFNLEEELAKEAKNGVTEKRDWGVQQVIGSGNHTTDKGLYSSIVTQLWGGMNYQIEHHLFPSVSHMHYAAISPIVEKTCQEFDVPYVRHSWFKAIFRFRELLDVLSSNTGHVKAD